MVTSAQSITPRPAALPPAAQNAQPPAPAGVPSFAQFLNDPSLAQPTPAADAAARQDAAEPSPAIPPAASPPAASPRRPAQPARPTGSAPAHGAAAASTSDARRAAAASTSDARQAAASARAKGDTIAAPGDDDDTTETSELKEFTELIGMAQPNAATLPVAVARPEAELAPTNEAKGDDAAKGRNASRVSAADAGRAEARDALAAKAGDTRSEPRDAAPAKAAALRPDKGTPRTESQPAASVATPSVHPDSPGTTPAGPGFAAALAHAQATAPGAVADLPRPTASAQLQAPLHSAAFAPELGTRVSLMAVDGVQQAQLQLNPAEMGPVNIQITVEAGQAQVSFHAVQAETRQALEQSLPDLAAALQSQGLTLSGGGVFQQAPRDTNHELAAADGGSAERGTRRGVEGVAATSGTSAAPVRRTVGLLDTFA